MSRRRDDDSDVPFVKLDEVRAETSIERFDRVAFARELAARLFPDARVVVCGTGRQVAVEHGPLWGARPGTRWLVVGVPKTASRRAILRALLCVDRPRAPLPYAADVAFADPDPTP